ncbi:MAG: hypothetical protein ACE5IH_06770, partial [Thermodesulfobacteriota bacterium]
MRKTAFILIMVLSFLTVFLIYHDLHAQDVETLKKELSPGFKGVKSPNNYGSFILKKDKGDYPEQLKKVYGLGKVVFPHWFHRVGFRCKVC